MPYDSAVVEAKIEALEGALTRQSKTVQFADRAVTYKSFDEILQQIRYWQSKLPRTRSKVFHVTSDKGFGTTVEAEE